MTRLIFPLSSMILILWAGLGAMIGNSALATVNEIQERRADKVCKVSPELCR